MIGQSRWLAWVVFAASFALFLGLGIALNVHAQFFAGDALSRVAAVQAVLFSRYPHAAAIGFVFTPLTALIQIPLVALSPIWPSLTADALSAVIVSALFMAGAVFQMLGIARDRSLPWWLGFAVTVLFAINPMIAVYGANGMSEAPFLFFLVWTVRRLIRWVDSDDVHDLVTAGVALGLAYLTRYDALAATAAAALVVGARTFRHSPPTRRLWRVALDVMLVAAPTAVAFFGWAITSWLVTGNAFAQFQSEYGNSAILRQSGGAVPSSLSAAVSFPIVEVFILAPGLPVVAALVVVIRGVRRRSWPLVAPIAIFGAVLAFQSLTYIRGSTFGFLRFYMASIPLVAVLAMLVVPASTPFVAKRPGRLANHPSPQRSEPKWVRRTLAITSLVIVAISIPVTWLGMQSPHYAPQEFAIRTALFPDPNATTQRALDEQEVGRSFSSERELARELDALDLPDGSVLTDTSSGFAIVVRSRRPKQFVQPSDRDFTQIVNDPVNYNVRYIVTVPPTGRGAADAINKRYPTIYENGAEIADLILEVPNVGANLPDYRVYRVRG